ncbi:MAG TPA: nucleotidyltransferase [Acidimicrobiales bacterium]|nr:nucleotidyltransferase [Acidimicrobiales bacterium]
MLVRSAKKAAAALREADVPFILAGGLACWVRGGPPTEHDVDLVVRPADVDHALEALAGAGMRIEHPPEEWLAKAFDGEVMIDVIFQPEGHTVDDELFARADDMAVQAVTMPVMSLDDILTTKLLALTEHYLDYDGLLELARPVREQIHWDEVRRRTERSPFARAFFTLAEGLGLVDGTAPEAAEPEAAGSV